MGMYKSSKGKAEADLFRGSARNRWNPFADHSFWAAIAFATCSVCFFMYWSGGLGPDPNGGGSATSRGLVAREASVLHINSDPFAGLAQAAAAEEAEQGEHAETQTVASEEQMTASDGPSSPDEPPVVALNGDAELYLTQLGIPPGLPELSVTYRQAVSDGRIHGESSQFSKKDTFLRVKPDVDFDPRLGPCTLVALDPDVPVRKKGGTSPNVMGPWLHWLVADAEGAADAGTDIVPYAGPVPAKGNHRLIFVLFQQGEGHLDFAAGVKRAKWKFDVFLQANPGMKPVAVNFLYTSAQ